MISKYSNVYINDIEDYFVALIFMGLYRLRNYRDHWSNDPLLVHQAKTLLEYGNSNAFKNLYILIKLIVLVKIRFYL